MEKTNYRVLAQQLWDYHRLNQPAQPAEVMLVLGSHDLRVADYAAYLFKQQVAPLIVISGGQAHQTDLLRTNWRGTEAQQFADRMIFLGVPREKIVLEIAAQNTGENFVLSKPLIDQLLPNFQTVVVVTKPYMERRAYATGVKVWPQKKLTVTSPPGSYEEYVQGEIGEEDVINIMVGDLQRIKVYGDQGYQVPQEVPASVNQAFEQLKTLGYIKHLISK